MILGISLKMYMGYAETVRWCEQVAAIAAVHPAVVSGAAGCFVLPSSPAISRCLDAFSGSKVAVGAQDLYWEDAGPFTGEISGRMLAEIGCTYAEVGHAERRRIFNESIDVVTSKMVAALRNGLTPVVCVGETAPGPADQAARTCIQELAFMIEAAKSQRLAAPLVIAYEPHWAIGATEPATVEHVQAVCRSITNWIETEPTAAGSRVIYGGSAGPGLLSRLGDAVDGLFLGRFVHNADALVTILDEI